MRLHILRLGALFFLAASSACGPLEAETTEPLTTSSDSALTGCISSGTEASINAALVGPGAEAVLCPGAVFNLSAPVRFTAANQRLTTQGQPGGSTRALLRITAAALTTAVNGSGRSGITIQNVQVDGNRGALGYLQGQALIVIGGNASKQTVSTVAVRNTRSWSSLHIVEGSVTNNTPGCQQATITGNTVGPAGFPDGTWADGISLACGNSVVADNVIQDATDGAIVIFGAPGSTIQRNTIIANTRTLLGGINLVDFAPVNGNYSGTKVMNNTIEARGAFIKVGIAMGPAVWMCSANVVHGATVNNNVIKGLHFGYGYAANGVAGFNVYANTDQARHVGAVGSGCGGTPAPPAGFQVQSASTSSLQPEFHAASLGYLLGVAEPAILKVLTPATGCGTIHGDQGLVPGQTFNSCDGRFSLALQTSGNLVLSEAATVLWSSNTAGKNTAQVIMQQDGNVVLYDAAGAPLTATNTVGNPGAILAVQNDGNLVVYSAAGAALWASNTGGR